MQTHSNLAIQLRHQEDKEREGIGVGSSLVAANAVLSSVSAEQPQDGKQQHEQQHVDKQQHRCGDDGKHSEDDLPNKIMPAEKKERQEKAAIVLKPVDVEQKHEQQQQQQQRAQRPDSDGILRTPSIGMIGHLTEQFRCTNFGFSRQEDRPSRRSSASSGPTVGAKSDAGDGALKPLAGGEAGYKLSSSNVLNPEKKVQQQPMPQAPHPRKTNLPRIASAPLNPSSSSSSSSSHRYDSQSLNPSYSYPPRPLNQGRNAQQQPHFQPNFYSAQAAPLPVHASSPSSSSLGSSMFIPHHPHSLSPTGYQNHHLQEHHPAYYPSYPSLPYPSSPPLSAVSSPSLLVPSSSSLYPPPSFYQQLAYEQQQQQQQQQLLHHVHHHVVHHVAPPPVSTFNSSLPSPIPSPSSASPSSLFYHSHMPPSIPQPQPLASSSAAPFQAVPVGPTPSLFSSSPFFSFYPSRTLFIGNIDFKSKIEDFATLFSQFGDIQHVVSHLQQSHGISFVSYFDLRSAMAALSHLQGYYFDGRCLEIHFSKPFSPQNSSSAASSEQTSFPEFSWKSGMEATLVCFNIDPSTPDSAVFELFSAYGEVRQVRSKRMKMQYRFVEMFDIRACDIAQAALHRSIFCGKKITIEKSRFIQASNSDSSSNPGPSSSAGLH